MWLRLVRSLAAELEVVMYKLKGKLRNDKKIYLFLLYEG